MKVTAVLAVGFFALFLALASAQLRFPPGIKAASIRYSAMTYTLATIPVVNEWLILEQAFVFGSDGYPSKTYGKVSQINSSETSFEEWFIDYPEMNMTQIYVLMDGKCAKTFTPTSQFRNPPACSDYSKWDQGDQTQWHLSCIYQDGDTQFSSALYSVHTNASGIIYIGSQMGALNTQSAPLLNAASVTVSTLLSTSDKIPPNAFKLPTNCQSKSHGEFFKIMPTSSRAKRLM